MLRFLVIAITMLAGSAVAHEGFHPGDTDTVNLWHCDNPEIVAGLMAVHREGGQPAGMAFLEERYAEAEARGDPPQCERSVKTYTFGAVVEAFPNMPNTATGGTVDLQTVIVTYRKDGLEVVRYAPIGAWFSDHVVPAAFIQAQSQCAPRSVILELLTDRYKEVQQGVGLAANNSVMEIYASSTGSWTIIVTNPQGITCMIGSGQNYSDTGDKVAPEPAGIKS